MRTTDDVDFMADDKLSDDFVDHNKRNFGLKIYLRIIWISSGRFESISRFAGQSFPVCVSRPLDSLTANIEDEILASNSVRMANHDDKTRLV